MQNALLSGLIVATYSGIVSVFVVLRRTAFAAHALGYMSLTGFSQVLLCWVYQGSSWTIITKCCCRKAAMGLMGEKVKK